jgi:hypothetical protein
MRATDHALIFSDVLICEMRGGNLAGQSCVLADDSRALDVVGGVTRPPFRVAGLAPASAAPS